MKREYKILTALVVSSLMGFSAMTAEAEALTLTGSITDPKLTGNSDTGTTSGNTLNVTNASGNSSSSESVIAGGSIPDKESGDASNNTVSISGSILTQYKIYGSSRFLVG